MRMEREARGMVFLVGAGCGPADLITVRGLRLLEQCDAVVYDDLIDRELLLAAPEHARRIYMGKRQGKHGASQEEICETLIRLAREGLRVVRLKGGDPYVFGRGGEEMLALKAAGIFCEQVPGITSAAAIPAEAGIPVTHRGMSRSFHVITGHTAQGKEGLPEDLEKLAGLNGTLVFLMGLSHLDAIAGRLMKAGKSPDTPAAVLRGGCAPDRQAVRGTLGTIGEMARQAGIKPPAVIVARNITPAPEMVEAAQKCQVALLKTADTTSSLVASLVAYMNTELAPRITRHGVLVEVYGEGILLVGDSGVGKSETAIELIKRGHRLIADDAVEIRRVSAKTLVGSAPENIRHFIELRGIGIINARRIFGMGAVKISERIDMCINLEIWDNTKMYDRMGLDNEYTEIVHNEKNSDCRSGVLGVTYW